MIALKYGSRFNRRQRGAASLVVVMVLFFIVSMVAAYTSRNLIFEQRTSINQYRSTQALEVAEAGLEWALALFNQGLIDGDCNVAASSSVPGVSSFRQRYLNIDPVSGVYTPRDSSAHPTCVFDGSGWVCKCPTTGDGTPTDPSGDGVHPAFRVRFQSIDWASLGISGRAAMIRVVVSACTRLDNTCLSETSTGAANEGRAVVTALASIAGNLAAPPVAALLARGNVNLSGSTAASTDVGSGGLTVHAGGAVTAGMTLVGPVGTPASQTFVQNDPTLSAGAFTGDRLFSSAFNVWPNTFARQPAVLTLACSGSGCTDSQVAALVAANPGRPIWINGNLAVASDLGSAAAPLLLIVNGDLTFSGGTPTVYGAIYVRAADWTTSGTGRVQGTVIAEGNVIGTGLLTLVHDSAVLAKLRDNTGSLVRVPGSWKDFP